MRGESDRVYVALGSNLGNRQASLDRAMAGMAAFPTTRVLRRSKLMENEALLPADDPTPQPPYLNGVVELETNLGPGELLERLKDLEARLGRVPARRGAARVIDLDIILWGDRVVDDGKVIIPHPRLAERLFVLQPLAELAPELRHPLLGKTVSQLLDALHERILRI